jgi:hypothetical protein
LRFSASALRVRWPINRRSNWTNVATLAQHLAVAAGLLVLVDGPAELA